MAKKKALNQSKIIDLYMDYVSTHGRKPKSVYALSESGGFEEEKFYDYFESFKAVEQSIFRIFIENTLAVLEKSEDYNAFDARDKLLSFYYTFFEILTANRDYVSNALGSFTNQLMSLYMFSELKKIFGKYIDHLNIKTIDLKQEQLNKFQQKSLRETAWLQLLLTLNFWLDDASPDFEKTDVLIEKSVKASFDLIDTTALESVIDLGKFLFKEKINKN